MNVIVASLGSRAGSCGAGGSSGLAPSSVSGSWIRKNSVFTERLNSCESSYFQVLTRCGAKAPGARSRTACPIRFIGQAVF